MSRTLVKGIVATLGDYISWAAVYLFLFRGSALLIEGVLINEQSTSLPFCGPNKQCVLPCPSGACQGTQACSQRLDCIASALFAPCQGTCMNVPLVFLQQAWSVLTLDPVFSMFLWYAVPLNMFLSRLRDYLPKDDPKVVYVRDHDDSEDDDDNDSPRSRSTPRSRSPARR